MSVTVMTRLFALLSVVAIVLAFAAGPLRGLVAQRWPDWHAGLRANAVRISLAIATVATAGSLYLSEIVGFPPCNLCWVQRGFMYPLVLVLGVAATGRLTRLVRWLPYWAGAGAAVSVFHVVDQRLPVVGEAFCAVDNPCTTIWVNEFGFLTIPAMALCGFLAIAALLHLARTAPSDTPPTDSGHTDTPTPARITTGAST